MTHMLSTAEIFGEDEISRRLSLFDKIRHEHAELTAIHKIINGVRAEVKQARFEIADQKRLYPHLTIKANPLPVISIIGASGTSKSHVIKTYQEKYCAKENWPEGTRRVIDFELSVDATKRQFQVDALTALGDPDPERGTEPVLRRRVFKLAGNLETELAFTDEVQHFIESDTQKKARSVADAMKKTVNSGVYALVLLGTEKASDIFDSNQEFAQRVSARIELRGFQDSIPDEADLFINFLRTFRRDIEARGIMGSAKTLLTPETVGNLFTQASGRLGTAQRIMRLAVRVALETGARTLLPKHFAAAIIRGKMLFDHDENAFADYADTLSH